MPPAELLERTRTVNVGDDVPPGELVQALVAAGYVRYDQVDGTSQFALRGGILDIFPPGAQNRCGWNSGAIPLRV